MVKYIHFHEFLHHQEAHLLLSYAVLNEEFFVNTTVSNHDSSWRNSRVFYDLEHPSITKILTKIKKLLIGICSYFEIDEFTPSQIEYQLTAHGDGQFYKKHNDSGSSGLENRIFTYVYYLHNNNFTGGDLIFSDDEFIRVTPTHNSMIFFPSGEAHEVLPVRCLDKNFSSCRFTLNGWVRK